MLETRSVYLVAFIALIACSSQAQELKRHELLYQMGQKIGKLHEFEAEIKADPIAAPMFDDFNRNRKSQTIVNYMTLGLAGGTVAVRTIVDNINSGESYAALTAFVIGLLVTSIVFLIGNGIAGIQKSDAKKSC